MALLDSLTQVAAVDIKNTKDLNDSIKQKKGSEDKKGETNASQKQSKKNNEPKSALKNHFSAIFNYSLVENVAETIVGYEDLKKTFTVLSGSAEQGAREIEFLKNESDKLGVSFTSVADVYKNLYSSSINANFGLDETRNLFSGILKASTTIGLNSKETEDALRTVEQMISNGGTSMQELILQLNNDLPGSLQTAAKSMGLTTQEFNKLLDSGLDSKTFLLAFTKELNNEFGGKKLEESARSLRAEWNRLMNALFELKIQFADDGRLETFTEGLRGLTSFLESGGLIQLINCLGEVLSFCIKNFDLLFSLFAGYKLVMFVEGIVKLTKVIATAAATLNISLSWIIIAIIGVAAAIWAIIKIWKWWKNRGKKNDKSKIEEPKEQKQQELEAFQNFNNEYSGMTQIPSTNNNICGDRTNNNTFNIKIEINNPSCNPEEITTQVMYALNNVFTEINFGGA